MAELERQASLSESPPEPDQVAEAEPTRRSITSSALTSLLPIAAASGIVRPNYDTPKISFFSPSGNLIQPEGSSTPGTTSASDFSGSPTATTSYYDNKTTPATYPRSFAEDLKYEARFHRARLITAIIASCTSSGKGRVLRKRKAANRRAAATAYVSMPRSCAGEATARPSKKRVHPRQPTARREVGVLGPLAGHILRICFCQPYDGAGKTTASGATNKTCIGKSSNHTANTQSLSKKESPRSNANDIDVDAALPNARVVTGTERKVSNTVRQRTTVRKEKRHSSTGSNHHSRTRSDSAVSVGVAPSTATARG
ncbi:hypothetical protein J4E83_005272 [Alternaria metachromatica]|uniref:uncharacterized protein n=1 Tax=Alternaria metachromatica TaxID=283354 RepID=UPI0020C57F44|nr:uncharacterized protein J4E83_005272 [Alternaria metachromatica]KAI4620909.1 hypothetical protein J4E83_005272 [Alternaria metachromatica]